MQDFKDLIDYASEKLTPGIQITSEYVNGLTTRYSQYNYDMMIISSIWFAIITVGFLLAIVILFRKWQETEARKPGYAIYAGYCYYIYIVSLATILLFILGFWYSAFTQYSYCARLPEACLMEEFTNSNLWRNTN